MRLSISPVGWVVLILTLVVAMLLGIIFGRTNYIPNVCGDLKKENTRDITRDSPDYKEYLDTNNNGIACE